MHRVSILATVVSIITVGTMGDMVVTADTNVRDTHREGWLALRVLVRTGRRHWYMPSRASVSIPWGDPVGESGERQLAYPRFTTVTTESLGMKRESARQRLHRR